MSVSELELDAKSLLTEAVHSLDFLLVSLVKILNESCKSLPDFFTSSADTE